MARIDDDSLATLLLTSRLVASDAAPLKVSEYWGLAERAALGSLIGRSADALESEFGRALAERIVALLDRAGALAFAVEELEQQGITTLAATSDDYPPRWRERLGSAAPPHVHLAGPTSLLRRPALGIVGSRDLAPEAVEVAQAAARIAAEGQRVVVSGGARGTDAIAMHAALDAGGAVVGVLADALVRAARSTELRRAVLDEQLALITPYAPTAPFSAGNAMGRNKLIYALADVTFVVASDDGRGGTWSGAKEAITKGYGAVAVWRGGGEGPGNARLVEHGATEIRDPNHLLAAAAATIATERDAEPATQLGLGI